MAEDGIKKNIRHCLRSAETFSEELIVSATQRQLGWTHLKTIMYLKDELQRQFYMEMCIMERWSTRKLREKIDGMLYARTAISKKPGQLIQKGIEIVTGRRPANAWPCFQRYLFSEFLRA
jgi:hypothetical protein